MVVRLALLVVLLISLSGCTQTVGVSTPLPANSVYQPPEPPPIASAAPRASEPAPEQLMLATKGNVGQPTKGNNTLVHKESEPPPESAPAIAGLIPGSAAYQIPISMIENESSPVDLWIDTNLTLDEISRQLNDFLKDNADRAAKRQGNVKTKAIGTTQIVEKNVVVGKKMYAELIGPDFEIQPPGSQELTYIPGRTLMWQWLVKPKRASESGLPLAISVKADPGEGKTQVPTINEVVIVHARKKTWKEIFEELDWWIKLFGGGGIGAVVIWISKRYFTAKK